MNTTPVSQTQKQPSDTDIQENLQKHPSNTTTYILLGIVFFLLLVMVSAGAYLYGKGTLVMDRTPLPEIPALSSSPSPSTPPAAETRIPQISATTTPTQKPTPTIAPNADGNTYQSPGMGIAFYYAKSMGYDKNTVINVLEQSGKIYVYEKSMVPTTGQSIERFTKDSKDSLSQAISKKFLIGIPASDCFVKIDPKKPGPTMTKATISYPIPENADQPNFTYGEKCPEHYSESNGMAYFLEDSNYPDRFYYVSIGQYGIPAYNTKPDSNWADTIVVF